MSRDKPAALVTGGARRIGAQIVRGLHAQGYDVLVHYHQSESEARALSAECNEHRPDSAECVQADLRRPESVDALCADIVARRKRLDLLVNNASAFYRTPWGEISVQDWETLVHSNVRGGFFLTQALTPLLRKTRGSVVNISDHLPFHNMQRYPLYSLAKGALNTATRSMAVCLAPEVRVNAVALGVIMPHKEEAKLGEALATQIPLGKKRGDPQQIADVVCFLASKQASYVTGQLIPVDGGRRLVSGSI